MRLMFIIERVQLIYFPLLLNMSLNFFIVVKYTPHAMSHLKCPLFSHFEGFSSVAFDTRCCAAVPTFQSLELSPLPKPRLWSHETTAALPSPCPRSSHLLSESVDLPTVCIPRSRGPGQPLSSVSGVFLAQAHCGTSHHHILF